MTPALDKFGVRICVGDCLTTYPKGTDKFGPVVKVVAIEPGAIWYTDKAGQRTHREAMVPRVSDEDEAMLENSQYYQIPLGEWWVCR